ncbi:hypothetical protein AALP_AA1G179800 [Arabis alpina]|uniref:Uncharacterized protein n=1 Tax=Arabis alpina TaxID=50452 RepID=A0A087HNY4_ARAAL|nr:hypothetical protein AALP_AA1G179800 [Arabis alpina]
MSYSSEDVNHEDVTYKTEGDGHDTCGQSNSSKVEEPKCDNVQDGHDLESSIMAEEEKDAENSDVPTFVEEKKQQDVMEGKTEPEYVNQRDVDYMTDVGGHDTGGHDTVDKVEENKVN